MGVGWVEPGSIEARPTGNGRSLMTAHVVMTVVEAVATHEAAKSART
jgi:hypothetical protein